MRVIVDLTRCEANAVCMGIVPEVFELDEQDQLIVLQERPAPELADRVREAVRQCPRQAISVEES